MDFWTGLGFNIVLRLVADRREARRFFPVLAKVYVKIHRLAQVEPNLQLEIERQEKKEGGA